MYLSINYTVILNLNINLNLFVVSFKAVVVQLFYFHDKLIACLQILVKGGKYQNTKKSVYQRVYVHCSDFCYMT